MMVSYGTLSVTNVYANEAEQTQRLSQQLSKTNAQEVVQLAQTLGIKTDSEEIIITDSQMVRLLEKSGVDTSQIMLPRRDGVTKIISRGRGSWDVYISATWIQNYYWVLGAAAGVIAAIAPGIGWGLAYSIVASVAGLVGQNSKNGVIVRVRNWGISSMSYQ
ncbi:hypothetical protein IGJ02_002174 [Enterococcus sp. DIV0724b]|uniref:hypothetical protein n=1 Tax=Enterococcus sp. DIV0724b TaxID=2774694 RepID=UPI003D2FFD1E